MLVAIYHLQDTARLRARRLVVREQSIIVGSAPGSTIVIDDDPTVEPQHARFVIRAVDFVVDSLGGTVLVNGTPITSATSCRPGDTIQVGETVLKLRPESANVVTTERPRRPTTPPDDLDRFDANQPAQEELLDGPLPFVHRPMHNPPAPRARPRLPIRPAKVHRLVLSADPTEQAFLVSLRATPGDQATRMVYADWLQERGFVAKAEFVRGDADRDHQDLLRDSEASWRAITSTAFVEHCEARGCPQRWDAFVATADDERVRGCTVCPHEVRFCVHVLDLMGATARGERAIRDAAIAGDPDPSDTLDDAAPINRR